MHHSHARRTARVVVGHRPLHVRHQTPSVPSVGGHVRRHSHALPCARPRCGHGNGTALSVSLLRPVSLLSVVAVLRCAGDGMQRLQCGDLTDEYGATIIDALQQALQPPHPDPIQAVCVRATKRTAPLCARLNPLSPSLADVGPPFCLLCSVQTDWYREHAVRWSRQDTAGGPRRTLNSALSFSVAKLDQLLALYSLPKLSLPCFLCQQMIAE